MSTWNAFSTTSGSPPDKLREITASSLAVFVYPEELEFIESEKNSHKQVLQISNLYSFGIRYAVFCTAPDHYAVMESSGSIKPKCCVDIVVRHRTASTGNAPYVRDKFRIDLFKDKTLIGQRTISAILVKSAPGCEASSPVDNHTSSSSSSNGHVHRPPPRELNGTGVARASEGRVSPSVLMLLVAILSMTILLLPLEGESNSEGLPPWLRMTVNQKLFAAFALGLVTMAIVRS